jgi:hypothetical protein
MDIIPVIHFVDIFEGRPDFVLFLVVAKYYIVASGLNQLALSQISTVCTKYYLQLILLYSQRYVFILCYICM